MSPLEGACYGAASTAIAQFWTTPLDVVRNRVMANATSSSLDDKGDGNADGGETKREDDSYLGKFVTIAKEEGIQGLFAGASPRVGKALLSGAIQFATYEETKQSMRNFFEQRRT